MELPQPAPFEGHGCPAEPGIILILVLGTGIFAGAELATLTLRKTQLERLLGTAPRRARPVAALRSQPERFLATVQVGITVVGAPAAAFGGSTMTARLAAMVAPGPGRGPHAGDGGAPGVVGGGSYMLPVIVVP